MVILFPRFFSHHQIEAEWSFHRIHTFVYAMLRVFQTLHYTTLLSTVFIPEIAESLFRVQFWVSI